MKKKMLLPYSLLDADIKDDDNDERERRGKKTTENNAKNTFSRLATKSLAN